MPSSTSSSKLKFPVISMAVALCLFVGYLFIAPALFPDGGAPQSMRQRNVMAAQKYMYATQTPDYVVVGTSLSVGLTLNDEFSNLAFSGGNIYDGLQVITRSWKFPKVVLIEINYAFRKSDGKIVKSLFNPIRYEICRIFPGLRDAYRPTSLINAYFNENIEQRINQLRFTTIDSMKFLEGPLRIANESFVTDAHAGEKDVDTMSVNEEGGANKTSVDIVKNSLLFKEKFKEFSNIPDRSVFEARVKELNKIISILRREGVKIVFFEMPTHPDIVNSPRSNFNREYFYKVFPPDTYAWIPLPDPYEFQTSDAEHLDGKSAVKMTEYLQPQVIALSAAR